MSGAKRPGSAGKFPHVGGPPYLYVPIANAGVFLDAEEMVARRAAQFLAEHRRVGDVRHHTSTACGLPFYAPSAATEHNRSCRRLGDQRPPRYGLDAPYHCNRLG